MLFKTALFQKVIKWIEPYTFAQRCYFSAVCLFIINGIFIEGEGSPVYLAFVLLALGFSGELVELFNKVWETTLGKSLTIISYATLANIAFAFAAVQINQITGIEPSPFIFTLGFTTLVFAPLWVGIASVVFLAVGIVLINIWILISLVLKMLGANINVHWKDKKHAILSLILRLVLLPVMIVGILSVLTPYVSSTSNNNMSSIIKFSGAPSQDIAAAFGETASADNPELNKIYSDNVALRSLIADFIYYFEAYQFSSCNKRDDQHSVVIDENAVLLISENAEAKYGYDFNVVACERDYQINTMLETSQIEE